MAGTVAKLVYPHKVGPKGDGFHNSRTPKVMRNMEEDDILNQLSDSNFNRRADILEQLRSAARKNGGRLPFQDQKAIFRGFAMALADSDWDVRHQCIQLIHELIPHFGDDLDDCMGLILPRLVPNMGDSKITIRRSVIQTLHVYMKHTYDIQMTFRAIVQYGLENQQSRVKKEVIIALPMMFTPEFNGEDFFDITQSLAKKLLDNSGDDSIQQHALLSLDKIRKLVGDSTFNTYLQKLSPPLRKYYVKLSGNEPDLQFPSSSNNTRNVNDVSSFKPTESVAFTTSIDNYTGPDQSVGTRIHIPSSEKYEYGVIPSHIMVKLNDQSNFRSRAQAVEELKLLLKDMSDINVHKMSPHVLNFINYLNSLLEDAHFKITTVTLEILGLLVQRQGPSMKNHLKPLVSALTKRMGDNKVVIRQVIMKVVMQLMQVLSAKYVLSEICENLSHRNSRVRQETLNIVIASLLTFPSYDFDLSELCETVAHTLVDPKRQVRQAALECYAVIASNLGAGKLQPLVSSVDAVELSFDGDGVMAAVQARLARRILPKLNADGLVDYATPVPTSAGSRGGSVNLPPGADIEWILSASGGTGGSARSVRSDIELQSVGPSARNTPLPHESPSHGPTPRRSAGIGRLPWEDTDTGFKQENGYNNHQTNRPPRQRQMMVASTPSSRDHSPDQGSYRQNYLKQKKQQSTDSSPPFSVYNPNRDDESHSTFSTPRNADDNSRMAFSNSWPDDPGKSNKRLLEPIADNEAEAVQDNSPIPTKPTIVRGTSSRSSSKRKVPPIPVNERRGDKRDIESHESARDSVLDDGFDDIDAQDEPKFSGYNPKKMQQSLRQIRNSATRKKVDKIFEVLGKEHQKLVPRSPSPQDEESGIYSSSTRSGFDELDHSKPTPNKKGFIPSMEDKSRTSKLVVKSDLHVIQPTQSDATQYKAKEKLQLASNSTPLSRINDSPYLIPKLQAPRCSKQTMEEIDNIPCAAQKQYPAKYSAPKDDVLESVSVTFESDTSFTNCASDAHSSLVEEQFKSIPVEKPVLSKVQKRNVHHNLGEVGHVVSDSLFSNRKYLAPLPRSNSPVVKDSGSKSRAKTSSNKSDPAIRVRTKTPQKIYGDQANEIRSKAKIPNEIRSRAKIPAIKNCSNIGLSNPAALNTRNFDIGNAHEEQSRSFTSESNTKKNKEGQADHNLQKRPTKKSFLNTVSDVFKFSFTKKRALPPIEKDEIISPRSSNTPVLHYTDDVVAYQSDNVLEFGKKSRSSDDTVCCQSDCQINTHQFDSNNNDQKSPIIAYGPSQLKLLETYLIKEIKKCENETDQNLRKLAMFSLRQSLPGVMKSITKKESDDANDIKMLKSIKESKPKFDSGIDGSSFEDYDENSDFASLKNSSRIKKYSSETVDNKYEKNELSRVQSGVSNNIKLPLFRLEQSCDTISSSEYGKRGLVDSRPHSHYDNETGSVWSNNSPRYISNELKNNTKKHVIIPRGTKALEIRRNNALKSIKKHDERERKLGQNRSVVYEESIFKNKRGPIAFVSHPKPPPILPPKKKVSFPTRNYANVVSEYSRFNKSQKSSVKKSVTVPTNNIRSSTQSNVSNERTKSTPVGQKPYRTPKYLRDTANLNSSNSCGTKATHIQLNIKSRPSFCTCLQNADAEKFDKQDAFSPYQRKNRLQKYLNDCPKVPRYTKLYDMYKEGKVSVCTEHMYVPQENIKPGTLFKIDDEKQVNLEYSSSTQIKSKPETSVKNGNINNIVTKIKDGNQVKYLKKTQAGVHEYAKISVQKKTVLSEEKKTEFSEENEQANKLQKKSRSSKYEQKRIVVKVRENGVRVDLRSTLEALKASCEKSLQTLQENWKESDIEEKIPSVVKFNNKDINKQRCLTVTPDRTDLIEYQSGEQEINEGNFNQVKKAGNPFESKPRLVRKPSQQKPEPEPGKPVKGSVSNTSTLTSSSAQLDFSPHGGVTFKENPGLTLHVSGIALGDDYHPNEPKVNSYATKARERRRVTKGLVSSSSQSSLSSPEESNGIVGYSVFDGQVAPSDQLGNTPIDRRERKLSRGPQEQDPVHTLGGVFGVGVRQNTIEKYEKYEDDFEPDEEDTKAITISQATRATVQMKVQQKKDEAEKAKVEKERQKLRELEEKRRKQEAEIQREKERLRLRGLNDQADQDLIGLAVSGSGSQQNNYGGPPPTTYTQPTPKPPTTKPANTTPATKRKVRPATEERIPSLGSAKSSSEPESPDNLKPFKEPQRAFDEAMKGLTQDEWDIKCAAINSIRRLTLHHPTVLINSNLHTLNLAMISEVKNLRSQVSRLAIICLGEMLLHLKKSMEADMDQIATVLLAKAGESNNFIRDDTDKSLQYMVESVTPQRAMLSLIAAGASHRNPTVRKTTSYFLVPVLEKMGPGRLLSGVKDVTDKILPVAANFLLDAQQETRHNGQRIFHMLMSHEDFDKVLNKHLPQATLRNISDKLDTLKRKGLSDPPTENGSAKKRGSSHGSRVNSVRYHSANVTSGNHETMPSSSKHRSALPRTDEGTLEDIKSFCNLMTASDWRERQNGIIQMQKMVASNPAIVGANIIKIFDKFVPCLKDSNSKVNLFALQTMEASAKDLADYMSSVISYTIQSVASNVSSKNKDIYESACNVLDTFMEALDSAILLQPFCNQAQSGNSRIKPDMVERVAYLVTCVYPHRPRQVILHVLPLLWHLLGTVSQSGATQGGTGNIRQATNHLVHSIYSQMSDTLIENAKNNSNVTPRMMQCLQDMIDNPAPHGD